MALWLARAAFVAASGLILMGVVPTLAPNVEKIPIYRAIGFEIGAGAAFVVVALEWTLTHRKASFVPTLVLGMLLGCLVGPAIGKLLLFNGTIRALDADSGIVPSFFTLLFAFLFTMVISQTRSAFRFSLPFVEFRKEERGQRPILLDTSAIIDGRIAPLCESRLVDAPLLVPRFILHELQQVADSSDRLKRNRGRHGLEVLHKLQQNPAVHLKIDETAVPDEPGGADAKLLALAKVLDACVATVDFNLHKLARLQGVASINLQDVASALRPSILPGEQVTIEVLRPGDNPGQGVGFLEDGTMVVVEDGRGLVGKKVPVAIVSTTQTHAGRLLFARHAPERPDAHRPPPAPART